ncbi:His/Gly/Thr/Pro-type tRNA ligase C-terminal domain-containing protein [uncultured Arsenicicoccus sp.]|uniref:His/Gly/Thr/Pro-type tRNA ligase C-terminal domain-containing protein n=1 Tax=uncultured Arsenicicoccus sp. TaxID=491339 RepID=UPI0025959F8B|nr:His/Gly/Thr/Pro-type tRNA ligase C-terminal domain-containing protein [uncultured Arsenicicoccus sp.]
MGSGTGPPYRLDFGAWLRRTERPPGDLAHFATRGTALAYHYRDPESEWGELERIVDRSDDDLARHARASWADLRYYDQRTGDRYAGHRAAIAAPGRDRNPHCVTVDSYTLGDRSVTVRDRDTMRQERMGLDALEGYLAERLVGC